MYIYIAGRQQERIMPNTITAYRILIPFRRRTSYEMTEGFVTHWDKDVPMHDRTGLLFDEGHVLVVHRNESNPVGKSFLHATHGPHGNGESPAPSKEQLAAMVNSGLIRELV